MPVGCLLFVATTVGQSHLVWHGGHAGYILMMVMMMIATVFPSVSGKFPRLDPSTWNSLSPLSSAQRLHCNRPSVDPQQHQKKIQAALSTNNTCKKSSTLKHTLSSLMFLLMSEHIHIQHTLKHGSVAHTKRYKGCPVALGATLVVVTGATIQRLSLTFSR